MDEGRWEIGHSFGDDFNFCRDDRKKKAFSQFVSTGFVRGCSNDKIIPLDKMSCDNQTLIVFDDYLNTGSKNDAEIRNCFTNSRNKNCCCIYLSQSYYGTDKTIRLNCTHYCIFEFSSSREQNMICRELGIDKSDYQRAVQEQYDFLYVDKPKKRVMKNFNEKI